MSNTFHKLTIKAVIQETSDTVSILFDMPDSLGSQFSFKAGQYLTLKAMINGEDVRRSYSLSSAPHENEWKVGVKKVENGKFSTYAQTLKAGDQLEVMAPQGNFTLKSNDVKHYVLYAAGSGITPMISITKYILNQNESTVTLFYGNRTVLDTVYKAELDEMVKNNSNFRLFYILSREDGDSSLHTGRIDSQKIKELYDEYLSQTQINDVYSCGPEQIIHAVNDFYTEKGLAKENIHFELFTTPVSDDAAIVSAQPNEIPDITSSVTIIIDDEEFDFNLESKGKDILQAAQDADADVPFSCKGGVCCTCRAKVIEGRAVMDLNYALDPEEVEEGFILTCQAHPATEKVVISFDEY